MTTEAGSVSEKKHEGVVGRIRCTAAGLEDGERGLHARQHRRSPGQSALETPEEMQPCR